jgi:hypothetical protein
MRESAVGNRSVEVFVVDSSMAAAAALQAHRPSAEATHLLCRHASEPSSEFSARVLRRITRICKSSSIGSLWYVVGPETLESHGSSLLLDGLLALLKPGTDLQLVSPVGHEGALFNWLGPLGQPHQLGVELRVYPDARRPALVFGRRSEQELSASSRLAQRATSSPSLIPERLDPSPGEFAFSHALAV